MIINKIELYNFGSYEDSNIFNFKTNKDKNIILIGGKNGAGKTTLFTAIRLAIYGYKAYGYQSINSFYNKSIIKLINNKAKLKEPTISYIKLELQINNGQNFDNFIINRSWNLEQNVISENIEVTKNNVTLNEDEIADFEKYINQIIPPDLFDLYFFDGEKIADFFLDDGSKVRLKNAFLTLCGYDTFDIMSKNFKRILLASNVNNSIIDDYIKSKTEAENKLKELENLKDSLILNYKKIEEIDANIKTLDKEYKDNGGVTKGEWDKKFQSIKDEEHFRDSQNQWLKKIANDYIPFLILKKELKELINYIKQEDEFKKFEAFNKLLNNNMIKELFSKKFKSNNAENILAEISSEIVSNFLNKKCLLNLSSEQQGQLLYQIKDINKFNKNKVFETVTAIKNSIKKSQIIRNELQKCNIDKLNDYVATKTKCLDDKTLLLNFSVKLGNDIQALESQYNIINMKFEKCKKDYEIELKQSSVNDISSKAILMLDTLTKDLYQTQIDKIKSRFKLEIDKLMCKKNFINEIDIDSDFNIKLFRKECFPKQKVLQLLKEFGEEGIAKKLGEKALSQIKNNKNNSCEVDIEIDRTLFSNGEKQIFIMALYKSLMSLCRYDVPFVIDTPFARIDTEHRNNISKYFFRELNGQVFILSTNEEVEDMQLNLLKDKLGTTFMLENSDNKKTIIKENIYFKEVANVI